MYPLERNMTERGILNGDPRVHGVERILQDFVGNFLTSKPAEFYSKLIEELSDTWQQVI